MAILPFCGGLKWLNRSWSLVTKMRLDLKSPNSQLREYSGIFTPYTFYTHIIKDVRSHLNTATVHLTFPKVPNIEGNGKGLFLKELILFFQIQVLNPACSTTELHPCMGTSLTKLPKLALYLGSPCLSFMSSWDYRHSVSFPCIFSFST